MKSILKFFLFLWFSGGMAQEISYGVTAGTSLASGASITGFSHPEIHPETGEVFYPYWRGTAESVAKPGFRASAFMEIYLNGFFFRPEIALASLVSSFQLPYKTAAYKVHEFQLPLLFGRNINDNIGFYAGPVFNLVLQNSLEYKQLGSALKDPEPPFNLQAGIKLNVQRWGLDLRYEYAFIDSDVEWIDVVNNYTDPRQLGGINRAKFQGGLNQIIISLSYKLGVPESQRSYGRNLGFGKG